MKKGILYHLILFVLVINCTVVNASTAAIGSVDKTGKISITISTNKNSEFLVYVLKPNTDLTKLITVTESSDFFDMQKVDIDATEGYANKTVDITLGLNAVNGEYIAVIGGGDEGVYKLKLAYPSSVDETKAVSDIKSASSVDAFENVLKNTNYFGVVWSLDFSKSQYVKYKDKVLSNMIAIINEQSNVTAQSVSIAYEQACVLAQLKEEPKDFISDILLLNEAFLGSDYVKTDIVDKDDFNNTFNNIRNDSSFNASNLNNLTNLNLVVRATEAVAEVNKADRNNIISTIAKYNDVFNVSFDGNYNKVGSYDLAKELADATVEYATVGQVREKFNSSIDKLITNKSQLSISSGGGGGSQQFSGSSSFGTVTSQQVAALTPQNKISDINEVEWAVPYIKYLSENKIMVGDENGYFKPKDNVKREEVVKLIVEGLKIHDDKETEMHFKDVNSGDWFEKYILTALSNNIINGISNDNFGVGAYVTREDVAVMLYRALICKGHSFNSKQIDFSDSQDFSDYSKDAVAALSSEGIINGYEDGTFRPNNLLTRAEAAKLIYSIIEILG